MASVPSSESCGRSIVWQAGVRPNPVESRQVGVRSVQRGVVVQAMLYSPGNPVWWCVVLQTGPEASGAALYTTGDRAWHAVVGSVAIA